MNICIDGLGASHLKGTGLYTYTFELLNNLYEFYPQPKYEIIWDKSSPPPWKEFKNVKYLNLGLDRIGNNYVMLENYISDNNIHIYHSPNNGFSIPDNRVCKFIMTVQDILPVIKEEYSEDKYREKFLKIFPKSLKNSYRIIAVSDHMKNQIIDRYKINENKVKTIYPGCSEEFIPVEKDRAMDVLNSKYNISGKYILYAGSIHGRKNFNMLLSAYKRVLNDLPDIKLVIAGMCSGKRFEYYTKLRGICESLGIGNNVKFTDLVDYKDMPYMYSGSICTVNLSSYEGFPMTTVEAMACGSPAICMRTSVFKEIAGDGGVLVRNEEELRDELMEIIKSTSYRNRIIDRGLKQSKKYTWEKHIRGLVKIYESAIYGV